MLQVLHEFRHGLRLLLRSPIFALVALLTLALGSGAAIAIYTVVNSTLLEPLPYRDPDRLVTLWWSSRTQETLPVSPADFYDWRQQSESFEAVAAYHPWTYTLTGDGAAERVGGTVVTANLFSLLGAEPRLGRAFDADGPGAASVVILSDDLWKRRFGGEPAIVGKTLVLDGEPFEVVGVMPSGFRFPPAKSGDLWQVSPYGAAELPRDARFLRVLGRLKPDVRLAAARAEMSAIAARHEQQFPDTNTGLGASVRSLREMVVKDFRQALSYLQLAVLLALAIACCNVAILQLARGEARRGEVAMRLALGAGRFRLFRQLLAENLLLGLCGGALGLVVAELGVRWLVRFGPRSVYRLEETAIDGRVLIFALLVTLLSVVLFGLVPSSKSARGDFSPILRESGRSAVGAGWVRNVFVFLQVAITLILLVGAGLLINSFARLSKVAPGIRTENLLTMRLTMPPDKSALEQISAFYRELKERVERLPGVESFATSFSLPLAEGMEVENAFEIAGRSRAPSDPDRTAMIRPVSPGFFATLGIPLVAGRVFSEGEDAGQPGVVVINEEMARTFWSGADPIGEHLTSKIDLGADVGLFANESWEIVGIVGDVKHQGLEEAIRPEIYLSTLQGPWRWINLLVRTSLEPADLIKPVTAEVHAMDPNLPITGIRTMEQIIADSLGQPRFNTWLISVFATFALVLTMVGIYGVLSFAVSQRRREIGLRMALGARQGSVVWMVVKRWMTVVVVGLAAGLVGSFFVAKLMAGLLFGVTPADPATFVGVSVILALVALLASYLPARRAAGLEPMTALYYE